MTPEISVIVPIYNAESYLRRCIDSILAQTFENFELLLIDDGSPDHSGEICEEYVRKDKRVRVFHKINGGVGSARQLGIEQAIGNYTIHADPDDWMEPEMLMDMYEKAISERAQLVISDFWIDKGRKTVHSRQEPNSLTTDQVLKDLFQQLHGSCCNKLIKSAYYKDYCVDFLIGLNYCEDVIFWVRLLQYPMKIAYLPKAYYHYDKVINNESLTQVYSENTIQQHMLYLDYLKSCLPIGVSRSVYNIAVLNVAYDEFIHNALTNKVLFALAYKNRKSIFSLSKPFIAKLLFYAAVCYNKKVALNLFKAIYFIKEIIME